MGPASTAVLAALLVASDGSFAYDHHRLSADPPSASRVAVGRVANLRVALRRAELALMIEADLGRLHRDSRGSPYQRPEDPCMERHDGRHPGNLGHGSDGAEEREILEAGQYS